MKLVRSDWHVHLHLRETKKNAEIRELTYEVNEWVWWSVKVNLGDLDVQYLKMMLLMYNQIDVREWDRGDT